MYFISTLGKAVKEAKRIKEKNIRSSFSFLPIETKDEKKINKTVAIYFQILDSIKKENLDTEISVKIHQFGNEGAHPYIERVVEYADKLGIFVWIDMERASSVEDTIKIFNNLFTKYKNIGICLQTYLNRTEEDLKNFNNMQVPVRLVKGFYRGHDFKEWQGVTENFSRLQKILLLENIRPCLGTHDAGLIEEAKKIIKENTLTAAEFQFFYKVREDLAYDLAREGFKTTIYIPYGNIFPYLLKGFHTFENWRNFQRLLRWKKIY
jgi:proline dehydrogenase